jgi:hypothetical protein
MGYSDGILDIPPIPEGGELVRIRPDRVGPLAESFIGMDGEWDGEPEGHLIRLEFDCDSNGSGGGYDGEPDSDVTEMTIRLEVDSDSNDSDSGYDGEPDSDVAETTIPSDGDYAGEPDGDGMTIPSDGEYAGEPDGDGAEINIGAAAGTVGSASESD